jgi:hypothetical protein
MICHGRRTCDTGVSAAPRPVSPLRDSHRAARVRRDARARHAPLAATLKNTSATEFSGPVSLALDGLTGANLLNPAGATECAQPAGSPYVHGDDFGDAHAGHTALEHGAIDAVSISV